MENKINGSCNGRGCRVVILPWDKLPDLINTKVFSTRHDIQTILPVINLSLDKKLAKKRP